MTGLAGKPAIHTLFINWFDQKVYNFPHEGMVLLEEDCRKVVDFFEQHHEIKYDLFNSFTTAEEYAIQTLLINLTRPVYNIGKWSEGESKIEPTDTGIYMYKVARE